MEEIIPFFFSFPWNYICHLAALDGRLSFLSFFFPLEKQSSVYVCLCTWNEEWQSTYEATLCSLSLIPIQEEIGVTREDTHTCWTFKFQLHVSEGGRWMRRPSNRAASTRRFIYVTATSVLNQAPSNLSTGTRETSAVTYMVYGRAHRLKPGVQLVC